MGNWLTEVADYMPHGMCLNWQPWLMELHVVSDALIALAYFAIPFGIALFVRRRPDLNVQHKAIAILFAIFITACGWTHVMSILVLWRPYYRAEGVLKAFTALVSVGTAAALPYLIPQLIRIPSPRVLEAEVASHRETLAKLEAARLLLAQRIEATQSDLEATSRRFQAALKDSQVTVSEQDAALRYIWIYNPASARPVDEIVGRTDAELIGGDSAALLTAVKTRVLETGAAERLEFSFSNASRKTWLDMRIERLEDAGGVNGLVTTATDITRLKQQEEHLRLVMRELNHRSKNLLTIVLSLARQTARSFDVPSGFLARLQERLSALANAHDVLARTDWQGADIKAVVQGQLQHQIDTFPSRIKLHGDACVLEPEMAHYVGMALHELGSNAVKHGALVDSAGTVEIAWRKSRKAGAPTLVLTWTESGGAPVTAPDTKSFGTLILTKLAPQALGGEASLEFGADGLKWTLRAPLEKASPAADVSAPISPPAFA
jgi:two-component sensor histidine kinase